MNPEALPVASAAPLFILKSPAPGFLGLVWIDHTHEQGSRQAAPRGRGRPARPSRKRSAAAAWENSDASLSGSDSEESELSSVPSERGGRGQKDGQEWEAPKDPDRPELHDSDEDSEYEAMRRCSYFLFLLLKYVSVGSIFFTIGIECSHLLLSNVADCVLCGCR